MMNLLRLHVPVFEPFLQLPGAADLVRREAGASGGKLFPQVLVLTENLCGFDRVGEQVAEDLHVHRRPGANGGAERVLVLGRDGWIGDEPFVFRFFDQCVEEEFRRALDGWINFGQVD